MIIISYISKNCGINITNRFNFNFPRSNQTQYPLARVSIRSGKSKKLLRHGESICYKEGFIIEYNLEKLSQNPQYDFSIFDDQNNKLRENLPYKGSIYFSPEELLKIKTTHIKIVLKYINEGQNRTIEVINKIEYNCE